MTWYLSNARISGLASHSGGAANHSLPGVRVNTILHMKNLQCEGAETIISFQHDSRGSGAYQAALGAAAMLREKLPKVRIEVIDTLNVALCQGWIAIEAARAAIAGFPLKVF